MITDRDIVLRCVAASADPNQTSVGAIMTSRVLAVDPEDDAQKAAEVMAREQVRRAACGRWRDGGRNDLPGGYG